MKKIVLGMGLLLVCNIVAVAGEGWLTDFEAAKKVAVEKQLPILVDFSGSDWCHWCVKLDEEVFSKAEFKKYAKDNLVLFMADFPQRTKQPAKIKKQNEMLATGYGVRGFPTVLVLDATGKEIARTGYQAGGPEKYIEHIKGLLPAKKVEAKKEIVKKEKNS